MPAKFLHAQPHSNEAERTTLGALLLDPEKIVDVAPKLRPDDFYDPTHRLIYKAIHRLYEARTPIDLDRKSTRLNSSHIQKSRMPSSA